MHIGARSAAVTAAKSVVKPTILHGGFQGVIDEGFQGVIDGGFRFK